MLDSPVQIFMALFGGYVFSSMLLLRNPTILHKKKNLKFTCRHISHRGGAGESYENTITTFKRAVELGTDMLEIDCHLTKDQKVVVCHDSNLLRNTGLNKNIADINYIELPLLCKSLNVDFDPGVIFTGSGIEEERKIPLLEEVFKQFPTLPINIDVKANNDYLIKEIDRLIRLYNREDITVWGSFSNEITYKCYLQNRNINLLFSLKQVVRLVLLFYSGLLPFFPIKESHLEIFQPSMYLKPAWRKHTTKSQGHFMVFWPKIILRTMDTLLMSKTLFRHLKKRGIQVFITYASIVTQLKFFSETYVWVLNQESEFKSVYDLGVTGIMTDYPTRLNNFLDKNPEYKLSQN